MLEIKRAARSVGLPVLFIFLCMGLYGCAYDRQAKRKDQIDKLQQQFSWWPTDAKPSPVKDEEQGGYWWWPKEQGEKSRLWGNRGYCYVYKIIFDYKAEELPAPKEEELRPSLLIKRIVKNVKVYFDYNKAALREDAQVILVEAVGTLGRNPETDILITGNCDIRGSEAYNEKLGRKRAEAVKKFMLKNGIPEERIRIVSRGKLDAIAHVSDLVGMQKDRNAQFMIAEVEELMIPYKEKDRIPEGAKLIEEGKFVEEKQEEVASEVRVSTKEYTIKRGDTLWTIAEKELGSGYRWQYIYQLNKGVIKNPNRIKVGKKIAIPIE